MGNGNQHRLSKPSSSRLSTLLGRTQLQACRKMPLFDQDEDETSSEVPYKKKLKKGFRVRDAKFARINAPKIGEVEPTQMLALPMKKRVRHGAWVELTPSNIDYLVSAVQRQLENPEEEQEGIEDGEGEPQDDEDAEE